MTRVFFLITLLAIGGCSNVQVTDYKHATPTLQVEEFFDGTLTAHGVLLDRSGRVTRSFNADIKAYWRDGTGTLEEDFVFDDGELQRRVWVLQRDGNGSYIATANDVVGDGTLRQSGNAVFLDYVLRIPWQDSSLDLRVDDRMYLVSPDVLINQSRLSKFGIDVGEILLTIVRHD
ncbi:MAG: DUF3833 domain-containing protein [Halioglobus sp.]